MRNARWIGAGLVAALVALAPAQTVAAQTLGAPTAPGQADPPPPTPEAAAQATALRQAAGPRGRVSTHEETGLVRFVGTPAGDPIARERGVARTASPEASARAFLARYGAAFGADQPSDLAVADLVETPDGRVTVRFTQEAAPGIPVLAGSLSMQLDQDLDVLAAAGELLPLGTASTEPTVPADEAKATAALAVARAQGVDPAAVTTTPPTLAVYDPALLGGPGVRGERLVWRTEATGYGADDPFRELVLIDAKAGGVALHFDQMAHGRDRQVCDDANHPSMVEDCSTTPADVIRGETDPATGLADADAAFDYAGDTYDFYFSRFGRDSLDGAGMTLYSETRFCQIGEPCPYANAYWNGSQMTYGEGFAQADDVVAHELSHGLTEFTSGLFYYYQSGAINESLSDVFGELIDLTNGAGDDSPGVRWDLGEDIPGFGVIRDMDDPTALGDPDRMTSANYWTSDADGGGVHSNSGVNNKAASLMVDGGTFNGHTVTGLGVDKVAAIYYEVETALLQSGSDYGDLYDMLQQACNNLVGTVGITAADCVEVTDAVDATEMNLETPALANPDAPLCGVGETTTDLLVDSILEFAPGWAVETSAGQAWAYVNGYAHSDPFSLWDDDDGEVTDNKVFRTDPVAVPLGVSTYLLFNHAYEFEGPDWDGGVIEYSTTGTSGTWIDAGPLFDHGGYDGTINPGGTNPLEGRDGFVDRSHGYRQSRIDLTSLAGENVHIRFRTGTDSIVAALGWFVDDLSVFTCEPSADPAPVSLNEIRTDQTTGGDPDEFVELAGPLGTSLDGVSLVVVGDTATPGSGTIEEVVDFSGGVIPSSGLFVAAESTFTLGAADLTTALNFEDSDNLTLLLVSGFTGSEGQDLDTNDDGSLDTTPWVFVHDQLAVIEEENPPSFTEWHYGPPSNCTAGETCNTVGPDGGEAPGHVERCGTAWMIGEFAPLGFDDTPGAANRCSLAKPFRPADFDGDGDSDIAIYRPSNGRWYAQGQPYVAYGIAGDMPVPGDYDGDGATDVAVFRPSTGRWYIQGEAAVGYGIDGDVPVPADYDGDGTTDIAIYRPSNGRWYIQGQAYIAYGINGDIPVPGDYDGDGAAEAAVFRPSNGRWYIQGQAYVPAGINGDMPVPGDYDGDGTTDIAIYRPSNGRWYIQGQAYVPAGINGDMPVPGDYDGDGTTDIAIYRPSNGRWYVQGQPYIAYGIPGDIPLPLPDAIGRNL